jgi:hypothetical protein
MMSLEITRSVRIAGLAAVAIVLIGGVVLWQRSIVPSAVPPRQSFISDTKPGQPPARTLSRIATAKGWTINGRPVVDGLTLRPGENLAIQIDLQLAAEGTPKPREPWSARGPWIAGKDLLNVWIRFAQDVPWSDQEIVRSIHHLSKRRPKRPNEPHAGIGIAPQRIGEYELQVVVHKQKMGAFGINTWTGGDVVAAYRVRVAPPDAE